MANEQLGIKRDCPNCNARFYDLRKDPAECPKCAHVFVPELILKPRRTRPDEDMPVAPVARAVADDDDDALELDGDEVETVLEDADEAAAPAKSGRKAALDDEAPADEDATEEDDLGEDLGDIDINIDDGDALLEDDEDDDDDLSGVIPGADEDDER